MDSRMKRKRRMINKDQVTLVATPVEQPCYMYFRIASYIFYGAKTYPVWGDVLTVPELRCQIRYRLCSWRASRSRTTRSIHHLSSGSSIFEQNKFQLTLPLSFTRCFVLQLALLDELRRRGPMLQFKLAW